MASPGHQTGVLFSVPRLALWLPFFGSLCHVDQREIVRSRSWNGEAEVHGPALLILARGRGKSRRGFAREISS